MSLDDVLSAPQRAWMNVCSSGVGIAWWVVARRIEKRASGGARPAVPGLAIGSAKSGSDGEHPHGNATAIGFSSAEAFARALGDAAGARGLPLVQRLRSPHRRGGERPRRAGDQTGGAWKGSPMALR